VQSTGARSTSSDRIDTQSSLDSTLVLGIVERRHSALDEIHARYAALIFHVAYEVSRQHLIAADVVQEVFLRLWRSPDRVDQTRGTLRAFLMLEARARTIDFIRRDATRRQREDRTARLDLRVARGADDSMWERMRGAEAREALRRLPPEQRAAIELAYFGGHSYRTVATMLGEPEGTVKNRIRIGLRQLRHQLAGADDQL